jgi:hypothetical protein
VSQKDLLYVANFVADGIIYRAGGRHTPVEMKGKGEAALRSDEEGDTAPVSLF